MLGTGQMHLKNLQIPGAGKVLRLYMKIGSKSRVNEDPLIMLEGRMDDFENYVSSLPQRTKEIRRKRHMKVGTKSRVNEKTTNYLR